MVYSQILHPVDYHPARIRVMDEILANKLNFEDIKFPVKIEEINKIDKKEFYWH